MAFNDFSVFVFNERQNMNCLLGTKAASSVRWYSIPPPHKNEYHIRDERKEIRNDLLLNKNFSAAAAAYKLHIAHTYTPPNGSIIEHHPIAEPNTLFCCDPRVWVKQVSKQAVCFSMNAWILASLCRVSGECVRACVSEWVSDWMSVHVYVHQIVSVSLYVCMYGCVCVVRWNVIRLMTITKPKRTPFAILCVRSGFCLLWTHNFQTNWRPTDRTVRMYRPNRTNERKEGKKERK